MTDETQQQRQAEATTIPVPEDRAREGLEGVPIRAGGFTWLLADTGLARVADASRDRMFEDVVISQEVTMRDVHTIAWIALAANYRLEPREVAAIVGAADEDELIEAVRKSAFPHEYRAEDRSYSAWLRSSLAANGLDPARIARADLPHVLRQLVATGRAMSLTEFTRAGEYTATRRQLLSMD